MASDWSTYESPRYKRMLLAKWLEEQKRRYPDRPASPEEKRRLIGLVKSGEVSLADARWVLGYD